MLKIVGKIILSLFFAIVLWEIILENVIFQSPGSWIHPALGRIYCKGIHVDGTEGYSKSQVNSLGMRNEEIQNKVSNEYRILVLGDSFTYGAQCEDSSVYPVKLGENIQRINRKITVINAGRDGTSPAYYIALNQFFNQTVQPDFVVIQVNQGDFESDLKNDTKNFYLSRYENSFKILENKNAGNANVDSLLNLVPFLSSFREIAGKVSILQRGRQQIDGLLRSQIVDPSTEQLSEDNDEMISWTIKELKKKYPHVILLYIPTVDYEDPNSTETEVESLVNLYAAQYQVPCIDMRDRFISYFKETKQPAHGFNNTQPGTGHTNVVGHELIAEALAEYFENEVFK